ncbi:DUF4259 domain-containing protein [Streptomyces sp. AC495_CC817]|uniref:DUF4259 domain-containing protein n=1 Tax=Streptomyces sp. AC495_CC817 TaxID=2823900 RepID=UPI001C25A138|nr:DUF4259 domain-containing protein [Streptomyces sp. AC495_CC817]
MGTWGPGNFDDDTVADGLSEITDDLIAKIAEQFDDEDDDTALEPDEWGGSMVPAWLEILTDIAGAGRVGATFPDSSTVTAWRDRYLRVWDEYIDELEPTEEHRADRLAVLTSTFERALELARERED